MGGPSDTIQTRNALASRMFTRSMPHCCRNIWLELKKGSGLITRMFSKTYGSRGNLLWTRPSIPGSRKQGKSVKGIWNE